MQLPKILFDSVSKFYLSLGTFLLTLCGILVLYLAYPSHILFTNILSLFTLFFGFGGLFILIIGVQNLFAEQKDKDNLAALLKKEKELDIKLKEIEIDKKINELSKDKEALKRVKILEEQKALLESSKEIFNNLTSTTTLSMSSGTIQIIEKLKQ